MHEYSVVQSLLEKVEKFADQNEAEQVTKVVVKIGVMSGIEPHLLEIAFNTFKEKTICDGAEFIMNIQPISVHCQGCDMTSELQKAHYLCPACGSAELAIVDGEEMYLMSLEML